MRFRYNLLFLFFVLSFVLSLFPGGVQGQITELCPNPYGDEGAEYIKAHCAGNCYLSDGEGSIEFSGNITAAKNSSRFAKEFGTRPDIEFPSRFALSNSGETVSLFRDGELIHSFTYGEDVDHLDEGVIYFKTEEDWDFRYQDWSDFEVIEDNVSGRLIISPASYSVDAQKEVLLASYTLTNYQFSELAENVDVEVFLDATPVGGIPLEEKEAIRGVKAHFLKAESYQNFHYKFAVIDGQKVILTTENWNWDKRGYIVELHSDRAAQFFHQVLEHDQKYEGQSGKTGGIGGNGEEQSAPGKQFNFHSRVDVFVLPDYNPVFDFISHADNRVYIQVPYINFEWFKGTPLLDSILVAAEKGAEVKILLDGQYNIEKNQRTVDFINELAEKRDLNMEARIMEMALHGKMVVADDHILITSANFNRYGLKLNREAGTIIYDKDATEFVAQQFIKDWNGGNDQNTAYIIPAILILSISIAVTYKALRK